MRFQSLLITGTDTGVGKTTISCGIAALLRQQGHTVGVCKPAETGCTAQPDGQRLAADAARLQFFAECSAPLDVICPYTLRDPLAPLVAADREGVTIDPERIATSYRRVAGAHDITLVEGAGGLLVPLTTQLTFAELARDLDLAVVVVVASRLGAISHALLTLRYARHAGLRVLGYIVNFLASGGDLAADTNVRVLTDLAGPPLGVVPYLGEMDLTAAARQRLGQQFAAFVQVDRLLVRSP